MSVRQGDIFWIDLGEPDGSAPSGRRPCVVVQNDYFNQSTIQTVVLCPTTTNLTRAVAPGNVLLHRGEGNLPRDSVVNVSQPFTIDRSALDEWIGRLSERRVRQIIAGIQQLLEPRPVDDGA